MLKVIVSSLLIALIASCTDSNEVDSSVRVSQNVRDSIARCGAGVSSGIDASLELQIGETIQEGVEFSAGLSRDLRAAFFEGADSSNPEIAKSFDRYLACIEKLSVDA